MPVNSSIDRNNTDTVIEVLLDGTFVARDVFVADRHYHVTQIREIHSVVGGASAAIRPRKITDTSAPGASAGTTVKEITTANISLTSTINTVQTPTLATTLNDRRLKPGDRIAINPSGTLTGVVGVLIIVLSPVGRYRE